MGIRNPHLHSVTGFYSQDFFFAITTVQKIVKFIVQEFFESLVVSPEALLAWLLLTTIGRYADRQRHCQSICPYFRPTLWCQRMWYIFCRLGLVSIPRIDQRVLGHLLNNFARCRFVRRRLLFVVVRLAFVFETLFDRVCVCFFYLSRFFFGGPTTIGFRTTRLRTTRLRNVCSELSNSTDSSPLHRAINNASSCPDTYLSIPGAPCWIRTLPSILNRTNYLRRSTRWCILSESPVFDF